MFAALNLARVLTGKHPPTLKSPATGPAFLSQEERKVRALESIAESLAKLANPLVKVDDGSVEAPAWYRVVPDTTARYVDAETNRRPFFTFGPEG
jgi:hypothetical protein